MPTVKFPARWLLTQNSELKADGVFNWTLPAFVTKLRDGRKFNVCPNAGICARLCYARNGTYLFPEVREAHERNLRLVLDHLPEWERRMRDELRHRRYHGRHVRIHDSGDFFSDAYLEAWLRIIALAPWATFYAYTKEVSLFRRLVEPNPPQNFLWIFSLGGKEDVLIDRNRDRHADVFPTEAAATASGYQSQEASDLFAIYSPNHVGIVANNIPGFKRKQGAATFGELQAARFDRRTDPAKSP
jgi:Gene product 88